MVYANDAAVRLLRADSVDELLARPPAEIMARFAVYDEEGAALSLEDLPGSRLRRGERDAPPILVRNVVRATGEERWLLQKVSALRDPEGRLLNVVNVIEDVTTVKRAERHQRLLARASEALGASLDPRDALQELVEAIVPGFAECAAVDVPERGRIDRIALACGDAGMPSLPDGVVAEVLRDGTSQLWPEVGHVRGLGSMILAPLLAGGEPIGVLTLVNADPLRRFREEDLALAEELGRRAGVALLNTRSVVRRTALMHALQHGLLPPALPEVPGWPAAVTYLPAGELSEVGGDFYDIFRGSDGWMLMVGDVVGQGPEAATLSSLARYTVRAAAELTGDPVRAIGHLNSVLREQPGLPLCTVVCASLEELPGGGARLRFASAGHPAPLLVRGEEVTALGQPGTIAGAFDDGGEWPVTELELRRGDVLVLYTDGVLDAVGPDDRFGDDRLREALTHITGAVDERVARLTERLESFRDGERRDDLTVLMLEYRGAPELSGPPPPAAEQPRQ
jgi:serine phosphatase RsbU (regulator of sigma subunit)